MLIALAVAATMNLFAYWNADKMVLRHFRAEEVRSQPRSPACARMLRIRWRWRSAPGLPPKVYIIDNPQPNAFATGRNPKRGGCGDNAASSVCFRVKEIRGVMAHELARENRDTLTMTVTATIASAVGMLANFAFSSAATAIPSPASRS